MNRLLCSALFSILSGINATAHAQVVPLTYAVEVVGVSVGGGYDSGSFSDRLEVGESQTFGSSCGGTYFAGTVARENLGLTIETNSSGESETAIGIHFVAGDSGVDIKTQLAGSGYFYSNEVVIDKDGRFELAPNESAVVFYETWGAGSTAQFDVESGMLVSVISAGNWRFYYERGESGSAWCEGLGCQPDTSLLDGCLEFGFAGGGMSPIAVSCAAGGSLGGGSVSASFRLLETCCVEYDLYQGTYGSLSFPFSMPSGPGSLSKGIHGRVMLEPGLYGFAASGFDGAWASMSLQFSLADCSQDCDLNGVLDVNQIEWGEALDVNLNGALDGCDLARGDLDLDASVGPRDLTLLLDAWGLTFESSADLDRSGVVDSADLAVLMLNWDI